MPHITLNNLEDQMEHTLFMHLTEHPIDNLNVLYPVSGVEVGQHLYWQIGGLQVHAQVLISSWVVLAILLLVAFLCTRRLETVPTGGQNFVEYVLELIKALSETQIGEKEYRPLGALCWHHALVCVCVQLVRSTLAVEGAAPSAW